ncbi:single-stranded-DNA-specific exonuclease RecJ [Ructibacterium gallinarum]|uniref:Single-stranded-DNA-specific exonuclease RecJ n=1 Tax=Ructibacterium gallinarum TaxID=2779355 RepID=A0A9D5M5U4_9FIRM|nr:single-stranded-DNA-specific exonuclease RecJ [Ructibacterium gallinarum]MBE5040022.1 single-stranded-DNA-specific exonuclease RecJ [Ructibacterium gallinarum]
MLKKKWLLREFDKKRVVEISKQYHISPLTAIILYNRGIHDDEAITRFLSKDLGVMHDPYLLKDMEKAADRIWKARDEGEKITIYGDYDVDGITSIAILYKHLREMGIEVDYYVPDRMQEGYGVNKEALDKIHKGGTSLIITVDTGITAVEESEYAKELGLDVIVTDHHECKEQLPDVYAAIDPKRKDCVYPFKSLAGVGVVFKLIQALDDKKSLPDLMDKYADLMCLGTVADISPLIDENRVIVTEGLKRFKTTKNVGLKALIDVSTNGKAITTSTIGYTIAPRINASGRLGCASRSVELFLTDDAEKAKKLAESLCEENTLRQQTEQKMFKEAMEYLEEHPEVKEDKVIVIPHKDWHHGIVGIVSSKITEKFYKPSILFAIDGDEAKGSGRSVSGFNLFGVLEQCSDLLEKFGGHELAAGLTIKSENIEAFRKKVNSCSKDQITEKMMTPTILLDAAIKVPYITLETVNDINRLQPFGVDNPTPAFAVRNIKIHKISVMSEGKHLRMTLLKDGKYLDAVGFGMGEYYQYLEEGDFIDVAFALDINDYKGFQNVQLILKDIKKSGEIENI